MTDLVERVARALAETEDNPIPYPTAWMDEARAAIRVVLEEAAKVAINASLPEDMECGDDWLAGHWQGRRDAALAIRAMTPKDGE